MAATAQGTVRGKATPHGRAFLGIPYAAPPVGIGRFLAPTPHAAWEGERDATAPGPSAPQPFRGRLGELDLSPFFGDGWVRGDDYLTVNVWTPAAGVTGAPVVVFVHGGAFIAGSINGPVYDGDAFARDGVVFVSVNYRLGAAGFMHLPDAPDNRGLLDVVAALAWVRENISGFGGDPSRVTLMGQSAGAIIVGALLADPAHTHLFARAIVQSGSGTGAFTSEQAAVVSAEAGRVLGLAPTAAGLTDATDDALVDLIPRLAGLDLATATAHAPLGGIVVFGLVLPSQPAEDVRGVSSLPDLLIGDNEEESTLYLPPQDLADGSSVEDLRDAAAWFTDDPDALVATYAAKAPHASATELRVAILSDGMFRTGTRLLADAHSAAPGASTWAYRFAWPSNAVGGQLRASHLMELPFVFDRTDLEALHGATALLGTTPPRPSLATEMHAAWVAFATHGNPGWGQFAGGEREVRRFA